ncbi:MAG: hypothetical protein K0R12_547 [Gammaproteobacteria bacterium]|nr:hypothetical protein [Gammaproteobacteria bacterium]
MVREILPNCRTFIKRDNAYQTAHESLCAKLNQARTIADVAAKGDVSNSDFVHLVWCIADLLEEACDQCERLTPQDFGSVEQ